MEGDEGVYCCRGCLHVDEALEDAATLERDEEPEEEFDGDSSYFYVDGMHCSTCEVYLESRAEGSRGVHRADASYAADAMKVEYDPDETSEDEVRDAVEGRGYSVHDERETLGDVDDEKLRLLVGGFFAMLMMPWYIFYLYPAYLGFDSGALFAGSTGPGFYVPVGTVAVAAGVVLFYTGWPILRGAWVSLTTGHPNTDLLLATAATSAYLYSLVAVLAGDAHVYFDVSVAVVMTASVGGHYERRVKLAATERLGELAEIQPETARVRSDVGVEEVPVEELEGGETVVVREGERAPADGTVVSGEAGFDESLVTGEPLPRTRGEGDTVVGGAVATDGAVEVEVEEDADSTVDGVVEALWEVQSTSPGVQRLADRISTVFVPAVLLLGFGVAATHLYLGAQVSDAMLSGLVILVVSCPCALGLATPLAVAAGVRESLEDGVVMTDESLFERARDAETVVFDKTGTVTHGEMKVLSHGDETLLDAAAAVESLSSHPVAEAVADASDGAGDVQGFESHPRGVTGVVDGSRVDVGSPEGFDGRDWSLPDELRNRVQEVRERANVAVVVAVEGEPREVLEVGDRVRDGWRQALDRFEDADTVILTGDRREAAEEFESYPEVDEVYAEVPPEAKAETVRRLCAEGSTAMVGDGINDAPALAEADVGVAMGGGAALSADAADAVVTTDSLEDVGRVFELAEKTRSRIRQNIAWAFTYNAVALPLAVAGLINPLYAAVAMAASSAFVVANSSRGM